MGLHTELWQEVLPFWFVHVTPQLPQLEVLVALVTSQPVEYWLSQFL